MRLPTASMTDPIVWLSRLWSLVLYNLPNFLDKKVIATQHEIVLLENEFKQYIIALAAPCGGKLNSAGFHIFWT